MSQMGTGTCCLAMQESKLYAFEAAALREYDVSSVEMHLYRLHATGINISVYCSCFSSLHSLLAIRVVPIFIDLPSFRVFCAIVVTSIHTVQRRLVGDCPIHHGSLRYQPTWP